MAEGRFDNPVIAALNGFYDLFRKQELESRFKLTDSYGNPYVYWGFIFYWKYIGNISRVG
ncbi:hypothetical protein ES705_47031 [subsurface metagenome]